MSTFKKWISWGITLAGMLILLAVLIEVGIPQDSGLPSEAGALWDSLLTNLMEGDWIAWTVVGAAVFLILIFLGARVKGDTIKNLLMLTIIVVFASFWFLVFSSAWNAVSSFFGPSTTQSSSVQKKWHYTSPHGKARIVPPYTFPDTLSARVIGRNGNIFKMTGEFSDHPCGEGSWRYERANNPSYDKGGFTFCILDDDVVTGKMWDEDPSNGGAVEFKIRKIALP